MDKKRIKMNTLLPISVFIITKNEEERLPYAINSVRGWVDEVIIVDSGSSDRTVEVAHLLGADKVMYNAWQGYGAQKIYAEKQCKNKWVLNIDADEEISQELRNEIIELFPNIESHSAYKIIIKSWSRFLGKVPRYAQKNIFIRLYNKSKASFADSTVHDSVHVREGDYVRLKHFAIHRCFKSYEHAIEKINSYTSMQADDLYKRGRNPSSIRIIMEPFFAFFKAYILNRYFLLGLEGFIEAIIYSFARVLRLAKTREKFLIRKDE